MIEMRRRDFLSGSAALAAYAAMQERAEAFGSFGKLGAPLGGVNKQYVAANDNLALNFQYPANFMAFFMGVF